MLKCTYIFFTERIEKMLNKLKFFKHSGIERFGITFIAVIAIFIGLLSMSLFT